MTAPRPMDTPKALHAAILDSVGDVLTVLLLVQEDRPAAALSRLVEGRQHLDRLGQHLSRVVAERAAA